MKCEFCGKSPSDGVTTLFRQNPKGEEGIWRCEYHNTNPVDEVTAQAVAQLQHINGREPNA